MALLLTLKTEKLRTELESFPQSPLWVDETQLMCREVFKELSEAPGAEPSLRKHLHCGIALHIGYWPLVLGLCSLLRLLFFLEKLDFMLLFELPLHLILELSPCKIGESLLCIWGLPGGSEMVKNLSAM